MYDVIVVGARCAGSPLAMLLARKGYRVLIVDRAAFPSDTVSTHHIHQPGVARLKRWGLLEEIKASNCPSLTKMTFDVGPFALTGTPFPYEGNHEAYAPRRRVLDKILADAAVRAGAELRERFLVEELTTEDGRVTGIRGRDEHGRTLTERAHLVVGADGARSLVAESVDAPTYFERGTLSCNYYSYWSGLPVEGSELYPRNRRTIVVDSTNDGLTLIVVVLPREEFPWLRADVENRFLQVIEETVPALAERVRAARREERFTGTDRLPNFFREPYGSGWALVGDAGYHKDPITAQGISDAFRDAEFLAAAIDEGFSGRRPLDETLALYEQRRNRAALPMYELTTDLARLEPPTAEMQRILAALQGNQDQINRFLGVTAGSVPVPEFFAPENIQAILSKAVAEPVAA